MSAEWSRIAGYFLGPHGEQRGLFEELLSTYVRDHFEWRAGFHPEDPPVPVARERVAYEAKMREVLATLAGELQHSIPVSSPRYIGHMTSDLLLPAVLAQLVATLYNPNNVTSEVAPVTVRMEREVTAQLAEMIGFDTDAESPVRAWGHLTGGGTVANIESLWFARAARCWPIAVLRASERHGFTALRPHLPEDEWQAFNLPLDRVHALAVRVCAWLETLAPDAARDAAAAIEAERLETRGVSAFPPLHVIVPVTAHYSWRKATRLLGIGDAHLVAVGVTERMRMDARALELELTRLKREGRYVLAVVPVLGTTEFGSIDPVDEVVAIRERCASAGQNFWIHVDAAWGGYLASAFRSRDGHLLPRERVRDGFRWFPSEQVHGAFEALRGCDSVTVDPHKLGYVPFGVGALILRDGRTRRLVTQHAPYVFDDRTGDDEPGRYSLEGSRPGAMAAAVFAAHQVLPLDADGFGALPAASIRANERLYAELQGLSERLREVATVVVPYEPDTNLLCLAVNPAGNERLRVANDFTRGLYSWMSGGAEARGREYITSRTRLDLDLLTTPARAHLLSALGLTEIDDDNVFLLRHTLMNPVVDTTSYCRYLERRIREAVTQ